MSSKFESFDQSQLGAFIESTHGMRTSPGGEVYACGTFTSNATGVARWDPKINQWTTLGSGGINGLKLFGGEFLYIGGSFFGMGGVADTLRLAKWDTKEEEWLSLAVNAATNTVWDMADHLSQIAMTGDFQVLGGVVGTQRVGQWSEDTLSFSTLYPGTPGQQPNNDVRACISSSTESGTLVIGGDFTSVPLPTGTAGRSIARLTNRVFDRVGSASINERGLSARVRDIIEFEGDLWVGGDFTSVTGTGQTLRKVGKRVGNLGEGGTWVEPGVLTSGENAHALFVYKNEMYVGGSFKTTSGDPANALLRFNGSAFVQVGVGIKHSGNFAQVRAFTEDKDGNLIIGGLFVATADDSLTDLGGIVGWDGTDFFKLADGTGTIVNSLVTYES